MGTSFVTLRTSRTMSRSFFCVSSTPLVQKFRSCIVSARGESLSASENFIIASIATSRFCLTRRRALRRARLKPFRSQEDSCELAEVHKF